MKAFDRLMHDSLQTRRSYAKAKTTLICHLEIVHTKRLWPERPLDMLHLFFIVLHDAMVHTEVALEMLIVRKHRSQSRDNGTQFLRVGVRKKKLRSKRKERLSTYE